MQYVRQSIVTIQKGDGSVTHLFGAEADLHKDIFATKKELMSGRCSKTRKERWQSRMSYKMHLRRAIQQALK